MDLLFGFTFGVLSSDRLLIGTDTIDDIRSLHALCTKREIECKIIAVPVSELARSPPTHEEPALKPTQTPMGEQQPQEVGSCMGLQFK